MSDLYECPSCGKHVVPVESVHCKEQIKFYNCPECDFSTWEPGDWEPVKFDFSAHYKVEGYGGIAWYVVGYATETEVQPVFDDYGEEYTGNYDWEEVEDQSRVICIMVGDDREFTFDVDYLTKINEEDYCPECGQIGCKAYG